MNIRPCASATARSWFRVSWSSEPHSSDASHNGLFASASFLQAQTHFCLCAESSMASFLFASQLVELTVVIHSSSSFQTMNVMKVASHILFYDSQLTVVHSSGSASVVRFLGHVVVPHGRSDVAWEEGRRGIGGVSRGSGGKGGMGKGIMAAVGRREEQSARVEAKTMALNPSFLITMDEAIVQETRHA